MGRSMHDTVYVQNKSIHHTLKNTTAEEASTRVKPEIEHFRIFGCPGYFHVPKEKEVQAISLRKKGYNESSKKFQIDIPSQR
jgi:hypothetical protein